MEFAIRVPEGMRQWLENGEAHRAIRRETRQDIQIFLPEANMPSRNGAVTARERYNLGSDEVLVETENGSVSEIVAGICRAWASASGCPIECVREFISCLPVSAVLE
jgi:hypothetical protein